MAGERQMHIRESNPPALGRLQGDLGYGYYVLFVLILVGTFAWIDRQLLAIVLQAIKTDLRLSDTELGLIGGTAFGIFYVTVGLPIAWIADRFNRSNIIATSMALWSLMTALCGLTTSFAGLFLARVGVGIGEAGAAPSSQSILSDYFPPERRGLILGLLYSYVPLSYLLSYGLGGWVNDALGWRSAFMAFGLPGIVVAALVHITIREPRRDAMDRSPIPGGSPSPGFKQSLQYILATPTLRRLPFAWAAHAIGMVGAGVWMPSYFMRTFHLSSATVGFRLALILGLGGLIGTLTGGHLADLFAKARDKRWYAWLPGAAVMSTIPFTFATYLARDASVAMLLLVVPSVLNHMVLGPTFAAAQNVADARHRAMAAGCYLFCVNLISMGIGPLLVGFVSDLLQVKHGADGLRYSLLLLVSIASGCAGACYFYAARTLPGDLARTDTITSQ
jgi:MFS family permease